MASLGGGWISKGLRIKQGNHKFSPNEWKQVDATLDDIKKGIFPLPVREPSNVLFQLLGSLIQSSKELASVAEIFTGKMPGQNTPAYTTRETVEQGMKVFTAIYKRSYRALSSEFKKLYRLNQIYMEPQTSTSVLDTPAGAQDFSGPADDIVPAADPSAASMTDKMAKAQGLGQLIQLGLDRTAVIKRILEAMEIPNAEELFSKQQPPPPPEVQKMQMEMQMAQQTMQQESKNRQEEHQLKMQEMKAKLEATMQELNAKMQFMQAELQLKAQEMGIKQKELEMKVRQIQVEGVVDQQKSRQEMVQQDQVHQQKLQQGTAQHEQKMTQAREVLTLKKKGSTHDGNSER
jgi:hypothetical protein